MVSGFDIQEKKEEQSKALIYIFIILMDTTDGLFTYSAYTPVYHKIFFMLEATL